METGIEANRKSLTKHLLQKQQEQISIANDVARIIVKEVEAETGKELSLGLSMRIVDLVLKAQK